jgi:hypothetical protein
MQATGDGFFRPSFNPPIILEVAGLGAALPIS